MRVVSVLPSATETVVTLGAGSTLVGRSAECDYPPEVERLPVVMQARTKDFDRPSGEIDARVRRALAANESLYRLDLDLLARLAPDVILTQDLCAVCSVTDAEVIDACQRTGTAARVVSLSPTRLSDVWDGIGTIGRSVGAAEEGARLSEALRRESEPRASGPDAAPSVAVLEWIDPPILAGLWTPDSIRAAGGDPIGPSPGTPGTYTAWESLRQLDPDLVVVSPCAFSVERTRSEIAHGSGADGLAGLRPRLGTWLADEAHFSRPGPRLVEGIRLIRSLLQGGTPSSGLPVERWAGAVD